MAKDSSDPRPPFLLSCTVDFPDDIGHGPYTLELLEQMMLELKSMGVRRIYWLYYGDVDLDSDWSSDLFHKRETGRRTLENIGEPVKAAVPIAHRHGLEVYGVLKPYNGGIAGTLPDGSPGQRASKIDRIGGSLRQAITFIERYPHTRPRRRQLKAPLDLASLPIRRIRLLKSDDSPTRIGQNDLEVWTSSDNYRYHRNDVSFTLSETVVPAPREVRDYYGDVVTAEGAPIRALTLEGLDLTDRYILVTTGFKDGAGDFRNTAVGMLEAYSDGSEPLPLVVASRAAVWEAGRDFRNYGLEFDSGVGTLQTALDTNNGSQEDVTFADMASDGFVAFARGKNEYLACSPCEVYPEVRRLWRGWIDRMLEARVDGIDLRISAHGAMTDEPHEYGFNDVIADEYRERYGEGLPAEGADLSRLTRLRGEHYTSFVRETSATVRGAGKKFQVHMHGEAFRQDPSYGQFMGIPANIHFDWERWLSEGLLDGVTLRTSWFEALEDPGFGGANRSRLSNALSDKVVEEMLDETRRLGVPAYLNRYVARAVGIDEYLEDMEAVSRDSRFAGFDVYEFANIYRPDPDGSRLVPITDKAERIKAKAAEMGLVEPK